MIKKRERINEFADLFRVPDADETFAKCDDETGIADVTGPVETLLKARDRDRFGLPETAPEKPHKDGIQIEKKGDSVFTYTYRGGKLVKTLVHDIGLPGGALFLDGRGKEITRAEYLALSVEPEVYLSEGMGKILGVADLADALQK